MYETYSVNQEPPKEAKRYKISPAAEGAILGFFALLLTFITAYFIYTNSMAVLKQEIRDGLLRTVCGISACLDGDLIDSFNNPNDVNKPEYQNTVKLLQNIRIGTKHCSFLYVNKLVDGKVYYILDPIPVDEKGKPIYDDEGSLEPSIPMSPYDDPSEELIKALNEKISIVTEKEYTDRWGTFYSAYAPIYNSKNQMIGTLGADLRLNELLDRCSPMVDATKRAFIVSISLALLLGTFVWFTRRFTFMLNESRQNIYKNFLIAKRFADQSSITLGKQFQRTSSILKYTANKLDELVLTDNKEEIINNIKQEKQKLNNFAEKLLTLGMLRFSKRDNELANFSILEVHQEILKSLSVKFDDNKKIKRIEFNIDKDIPVIVYGSVMSYEELMGHLFEFFINILKSSIYCKTLLLEERSKDVVLRQSFVASLDSIEKAERSLLESFCRNITTVNWGEQLELAESVNIPIVQELLYVLGSDIKAEIKDEVFKVSFDFVLLKSQDLEDSEEAL